jgi:hypothetical protein
MSCRTQLLETVLTTISFLISFKLKRLLLGKIKNIPQNTAEASHEICDLYEVCLLILE